MAAGTIRVELAPEDYVSANFLHVSIYRLVFWLSLALVVAGLVVVGFYKAGPDMPYSAWYLLGYAVFIALVALFWRYAVLPIRARQVFAQQKALKLPQTYTWDDNLLSIETARGRGATPWSDFRKWRMNERLFLVYASDVSFYMIPKRAFPGAAQVAEFEALLREKIAPRPGAKRKAR